MIAKNTPAHIRLHISACPEQPRAVDLAQLSADEKSACARLATPFLQARYSTAHALLRNMLEAATGIPARQLQLRRGNNNRPELDSNQPGMPALAGQTLDFNLSYSGSLVACAVARSLRIGVDIERVAADLNYGALAGRVMTVVEREKMAGLDSSKARRHFFQTWTLKEAWAKARGEGLGLPFSDVSLIPARRGRVHAHLQAADDQHHNWSFWRAWLSEDGKDGRQGRTELALACSPGMRIKPKVSYQPGIRPGFYADDESLEPALPFSC